MKHFSSFITHPKKLCINCSHYKKYTHTYYYNEIFYNYFKPGKCSLFKKQNLKTGQIYYDDALECRINNSKCGIKGFFYYEK